MNTKGKKFVTLFLVLSLMSLSGNLFAKERRGAEFIIQKTYGQVIHSELIAVKENSLLLKDSESGADVSIDISDIKVIKTVKKSETWKGALYGLLLGGAIGFFVGTQSAGFPLITKTEAGGIGAAIGGVSCALIGAGIGTAVWKDKTIQIEGKSDSEIKQALEKLRKKARIPDYQ